jgi:hypothetical protein
LLSWYPQISCATVPLRPLTQKIYILVDGVTLDGREAELLNELLSEILNVACRSTNLQRLGFSSFEILYTTHKLATAQRALITESKPVVEQRKSVIERKVSSYLLGRHRP